MLRQTCGAGATPLCRRAGSSKHTYYLACPESPDGNWLLYFHSTAPDAHTGEVRSLARIETAEDAHRVACQQWSAHHRQCVRQIERRVHVTGIRKADDRHHGME